MEQSNVYQKNGAYWDANGNDYLGAIVLPLYGSFVSEEKHHLFGDVSGKKLLEIGCGNGRSLQYQGDRGAAELWGMDLSENQLQKAREHLQSHGLSAKLLCSPMEEDRGIPKNYFDYAYSIYALGWTTDLAGTLRNVASYLKKDGVFIFSWSHPIHKCVTAENDKLVFRKSYFDESWFAVPAELCGGELTLSDRKLSTYINTLIETGFSIERVVEETDEEILQSADPDSVFVKRAKMFPVTFVIKARKL